MTETLRILIIDDDKEDYDIVRDFMGEIKTWSVHLHWASTYGKGLEEIRHLRHDVVLLDYRLGDSTGLDLLQEALREGFRVPMILLTGQGDRDVDLQAMQSGAADYLIKGQINTPLLERSIRYALQRRKSEEALEQREQRFRSLIEHASDLIVILDRHGVITYESPSVKRLLGYPPEELLGMNLLTLIHADDKAFIQAQLQHKILEPGTMTDPLEARHLHRDGTWHMMEMVCTNLLQNPQVRGVVLNCRDISDRKRLQSMMTQSDKMSAVGQLAAGVAHEINNPLGVIYGFAQEVLRRLPRPSVFEMPLKSIEREANRCRELVQALLTFSRAPQEGMTPMSLNQAVENSLSLIRAEARVSHIEIKTALVPDIPPIYGNQNQIQQVIINLANNACDAMPKGGALMLATEIWGDGSSAQLHLKVIDNGTGIPASVLPHIFEPFYTTKPQGKGTGLGLSLVYELVQKHGASIHVESKPGQTCFLIKFPLRSSNELVRSPVHS